MNAGDPEADMTGRAPTSHRRASRARTPTPRHPSRPDRSSWDYRVRENFRGILMILGVGTCYLVVAAYGWGTRHFFLVPVGLLLAFLAVKSFFAWLSPKPPKRQWMGWVWLPLTLVPMALGLYFRWQDH